MLYLKSKITSDNKSAQRNKTMYSIVKNTFFVKKHKLFTSKKIHLNIKKRLIKTYVCNVATYEFETWVINDAYKKNLEALEIWC